MANFNAYQCEICGDLFSESELRDYRTHKQTRPKDGCKVYWATAGRCGDAIVVCPNCQDKLDSFVTTGAFQTRYITSSEMERVYDEDGTEYYINGQHCK